MADFVQTHVLLDSHNRTVVKLFNQSDGTGESAVKKVDISTLFNANANAEVQRVSVARLQYSIHSANAAFPGFVKLAWDGANTQNTIMTIGGSTVGDLDFMEKGYTLHIPTAATSNGDINLSALNFRAGDAYTIILELHKTHGFNNGS